MEYGFLDAVDLVAVADEVSGLGFLAFLPWGQDVEASGQLDRRDCALGPEQFPEFRWFVCGLVEPLKVSRPYDIGVGPTLRVQHRLPMWRHVRDDPVADVGGVRRLVSVRHGIDCLNRLRAATCHEADLLGNHLID